MRARILVTIVLALGATPLSAQSFNLDFGQPPDAPSSSYGGAGAAGYWNSLLGNSTHVQLRDLTGALTGVDFYQFGAFALIASSDPSVSGDDALLMNDGLITYLPSLDSCFYFNGLAPGVYELITYAWRPDHPTLMSKSFVDNTPGLVLSGGAWPGAHVHGVTYARHIVTVGASQFMGPHSGLAAGADAGVGAVCNGMQLRRIDQHPAFCSGDGSTTPCPCANHGTAGRGCANSSFAAGALLAGAGIASVTADTVVLSASSMTGTSCVFFQGDAEQTPVVVDDGLGCVTGSVIRLGTKAVAGNASAFPQAGDPSISVRGALPGAGGTRSYQCFYRNAAAAFCPPATSNRTNGVQVAWVP